MINNSGSQIEFPSDRGEAITQALPLQTCIHLRLCPCRPVNTSGSALVDLYTIQALPLQTCTTTTPSSVQDYRKKPGNPAMESNSGTEGSP